MQKKKILGVMQLPPPIHGASIINQSIKYSDYINQHFHLDLIPLHFTNLNNIGHFSFYKVWKMIKYFFIIFYKLLFNNYHAVYFTLSPVGIAFFRDIFYVTIFKLFRKDIIYHLHGKGIKQRMQSREIYSMLYNFVFNNTNVIHLSEILFNDLSKVNSKYNKFVVGIGINLKEKLNTKKINEVLKILYLSNIEKTKGVLDLIKACEILYNKGLKFKLNVVGGIVKSIPKDKFDRILEDKKEYINYLGPQYGDDKEKILNNSDVFVFPTYYPNECFPQVVLEAMRAGLPVISTFEGAISEIIDDGKTGYLVKQRNINELAEKIAILIKDKELREKMGKAGRKKFLERYTLEKFEKNMVRVFDQILNK